MVGFGAEYAIMNSATPAHPSQTHPALRAVLRPAQPQAFGAVSAVTALVGGDSSLRSATSKRRGVGRDGVLLLAVIPGRAQREPRIQWHLRGARLDPGSALRAVRDDVRKKGARRAVFKSPPGGVIARGTPAAIVRARDRADSSLRPG